MKSKEPWFLLTNITSHKLTRQQILRTYAKRFEIEEHFKDSKWVERYEWHHIQKLAVAKTVFMFAFLGWWLLLQIYSAVRTTAVANHYATRRTHPKKQLSWFRIIWEHWLRLRSQAVWLVT